MEIDTWINGCKVRGFPWVDGQNIYFHVEYYKPGQSFWLNLISEGYPKRESPHANAWGLSCVLGFYIRS